MSDAAGAAGAPAPSGASLPYPGLRRQGIGELVARSAARCPEKTALVYGPQRYSYRELDATINGAAGALAAHGLARGDRVALLSHNNDAWVVLFFALARLGVISVPINFMLNAAEVAYILEHCTARGLIVEDRLRGIAEAALGRARTQITLRAVIRQDRAPVPPGWDDVAQWLRAASAPGAPVTVAEEEPIQIMYTSGTESRPKGATLSSRNYLAQYLSCIVDLEAGADDVDLHPMPLYHCAQLHAFLSPGLFLGSTNVLLPAADPAQILAAIERERVTRLFCPPTVWIGLLQHADFGARDLTSLTKGYFGASAMPTEVIRELARRLPALELFNCYGQTEMAPLTTVLKPRDQLRKLGSVGRPVVNVETRIVDDEDRPVPAGTVGEIVHRGPQVMLGYWKDADQSAAAFRNGWFHSGDLGVFDQEGFLRVVDRKKDMIKCGGENVASREVEEVLYQHPDVAEAAVVGVPDPRWIEAVAAAVVLRPRAGVTPGGLIGFCRERLAGYKTPKRIVLLERLPKNASGKILKRELRAQLAAAPDAQG
ncbi:MAG TPA: fatty acyl-CoA synthetase [Steroidobacteraceae bacterium]|nr:fatty acyl-CoA synthetase [Steroidobacteraceae bacterium]